MFITKKKIFLGNRKHALRKKNIWKMDLIGKKTILNKIISVIPSTIETNKL